jgi:predicted alpha/beta-fold hydrolase
MEDHFKPKPWARNPHLQSIFSSLRIRAMGKNPMADCATEMILDAGGGVRLLGYISRRNREASRGLVLLLHGWEGSSDSTYIRHTGRYLFVRGFDIFRLNLRDHGDSHQLNEGLFHSALINEVFHATRFISNLSDGGPFFIIGFSLGGNFALRIARRHTAMPVQNLTHVFAISPVLNPHRATLAIDNGFSLYRNYFVKKWKNSLRKKQALFPARYQFDDVLRYHTCMEMTDAVIPRYSPFRNHQEYFKTYTLSGDIFGDLTVPVHVIASEDDPVIPVDDFYTLRGNRHFTLSLQRYGGHCGFLDPFPMGCWYERYIDRLLREGPLTT